MLLVKLVFRLDLTITITMDKDEIAAKMDSLEPGLMTLPETLALAEKALLGLLCDESTADNTRIKAIELVFQKHQVGSPEERKPMATKEDFEHLRGIISEVKEVLEGHVSFYERRYAGVAATRSERAS